MKKVLVMLVLVVVAFFAPTIGNRAFAQTTTAYASENSPVLVKVLPPGVSADGINWGSAKTREDSLNVLVYSISKLKGEMNTLSAKLGKKGCFAASINDLKKGQDSLKNRLSNDEKDNAFTYETTKLRLYQDSLALSRLYTVIIPDVYKSMSDNRKYQDTVNGFILDAIDTLKQDVQCTKSAYELLRTHAKMKSQNRVNREQRQDRARYNTNQQMGHGAGCKCSACSGTYQGSHLIPVTNGADQGVDVHSYDYLYKQNYQRLLHVSDNATAINTTFAQPTPRVGLCGDYGCHPCKHRAWITHSFWGGVILASGVAIVTDGVYMSVHHSNNPFYMMGGAKDVPTGL